MLRPRIIPCLLMSEGSLIKTINFKDPKYIGDPLNAVRIFNEKQVDELIILDIMATKNKRTPDFELIKGIAAECRMPLCYGGGVKTSDDIIRLISMGVEKVAICSAAIENPNLISEAASKVGSQSIVVVLDVKDDGISGAKVFSHGGSIATGISPDRFAKMAEDAGAGEIFVNNIDRDGNLVGYDLKLLRSIRESHNLPMSVVGGAGSLSDISILIKEFGIIGASAGSLFVFKGKFKAVLVNYPDRASKQKILLDANFR